jgi:hypothetical protein
LGGFVAWSLPGHDIRPHIAQRRRTVHGEPSQRAATREEGSYEIRERREKGIKKNYNHGGHGEEDQEYSPCLCVLKRATQAGGKKFGSLTTDYANGGGEYKTSNIQHRTLNIERGFVLLILIIILILFQLRITRMNTDKKNNSLSPRENGPPEGEGGNLQSANEDLMGSPNAPTYARVVIF